MPMDEEPDFYTQKGYQMRSDKLVTSAMEDYLEMICRQARAEGYARVGWLARRLNVRPSSASRMVGQLRALGLVSFERYGIVRPTEAGRKLGDYLLYRHDLLHRFFRWVNGTQDELEQVEQVEHYINETTLRNLEALMERLGAPH